MAEKLCVVNMPLTLSGSIASTRNVQGAGLQAAVAESRKVQVQCLYH